MTTGLVIFLVLVATALTALLAVKTVRVIPQARAEIKALDPAPSIMDAKEKQYRVQREKRAVILVAEGEKQSAILKSEGQAAAIEKVFKAIHDGKPGTAPEPDAADAKPGADMLPKAA